MSGLDRHTGSGVTVRITRRGISAARSSGAGRKRAGRMGGVACGTALALLIGSGDVFAVPGPDRVSFGSAQARELQVAAVNRKDGRITVEDEPLIRVIDELNRGAERKVKVLDRSDRRYRELRVTGQFTIGRPERIINYMRAAGIKVLVGRDDDGNFLLRLAPESR